MSKDLQPLLSLGDAGWKPKPKANESNIAYLGVDVARGQKFDIAMQQILLFKDKAIKAWFCDIVHTPNQTPYALELKRQVEKAIHRHGEMTLRDSDIIVHLNVAAARTLRARDKMYEIINDSRQQGKAKEVNFRAPDGRKQEVEY